MFKKSKHERKVELVHMKNVVIKAGNPVYGGRVLGKMQTKVLLLQGAIPGETVEISIEQEKKDYCLASVKEVIEPSPYRIAPKCSYFGICGGCHLQYISYNKQVTLKEEVLLDCLQRIAGIETNLAHSLVLEDNTWNYRHRGQFKVSGDKIGFYKEKSKETVDIKYCPLMIGEINEALRKSREIFAAKPEYFKNVAELHFSYGDGLYALVKTNTKADQPKGFWDEFASRFLDSGFDGIFVNAKAGKTIKYGKDFLTLYLDKVQYTISPAGFFQSNWNLNQSLAGLIRENLEPLRDQKVLDLYSGAGNFSLSIARDTGEVIAVEENPSSIEDGKRNLQVNHIDNLQFFQSPAEAFNIDDYRPDVVILDPPRAGLSERLVYNLQAASPEKIIYISCNPSTMARDLSRLAGQYSIESVRLVDFFPQTYHIESLAVLKRA